MRRPFVSGESSRPADGLRRPGGGPSCPGESRLARLTGCDDPAEALPVRESRLAVRPKSTRTVRRCKSGGRPKAPVPAASPRPAAAGLASDGDAPLTPGARTGVSCVHWQPLCDGAFAPSAGRRTTVHGEARPDDAPLPAQRRHRRRSETRRHVVMDLRGRRFVDRVRVSAVRGIGQRLPIHEQGTILDP